MTTGVVKWFNSRKGYGFIKTEDEHDVFVHFSSIVGKGHRSLEEGDKVFFDLEQTPRGPQAFNVRKCLSPLRQDHFPY
ncbi:cold-shock protein [Patescibacteria group bacterium]|nr:cold-shock protein [Patescibacteria group bacterium]